jgi:hypothetical protein
VLVWAVLVVAAFALLVFGTRAWTILRSWRQTKRAFGATVPYGRPVRDDAQALADDLAREGFHPGVWLWLEELQWVCLAMQRDDGTRATIVCANRPPGYDLVSEVAGGAALVTERSAFGPTRPGVVRQALGPLPPAALLAAHDRALEAAGRPALVVHPWAEVTDAALGFEQRSLEEILQRGWSNAFGAAFRQMFNRQLDTVPVIERPADIERLRSTAPR